MTTAANPDANDTPVCANCGQTVAGAYCQTCGQRQKQHSTIVALATDALESIVHADGRFFRTLPRLVFAPGSLAREWREGARQRYVSPVHLFLLAAFLLFLTPSFQGRHLSLPEATQVGPRAQAAEAPGGVRLTIEERTESERRFAAFVRDRLGNPEYRSYRAETLGYKLSLLLPPLGALVLGLLLFGKRGFSLYDHAVVALNGAAFVSLLAALAFALPDPLAFWFGAAVLPSALAHTVAHLHGAYTLSWIGAAIRALLYTLLMLVLSGLFALGIVLLSLL